MPPATPPAEPPVAQLELCTLPGLLRGPETARLLHPSMPGTSPPNKPTANQGPRTAQCLQLSATRLLQGPGPSTTAAGRELASTDAQIPPGEPPIALQTSDNLFPALYRV